MRLTFSEQTKMSWALSDPRVVKMLEIFKGDILNGLLVLVISIDIFTLVSPYWIQIDQLKTGPASRASVTLYGFGLWEICDLENYEEKACYSWSTFFEDNQGQ